MNSLGWIVEPWTHEIYVMLFECDFEDERLCGYVLQEIRKYADSILCTLPIENVFNDARNAASKSRKGSFEPAMLWHKMAMGGTVISLDPHVA